MTVPVQDATCVVNVNPFKSNVPATSECPVVPVVLTALSRRTVVPLYPSTLNPPGKVRPAKLTVVRAFTPPYISSALLPLKVTAELKLMLPYTVAGSVILTVIATVRVEKSIDPPPCGLAGKLILAPVVALSKIAVSCGSG